MRIYMDNCCYNRPYDPQDQTRIHLETVAKLYVQEMVKNDEVKLASSFVETYENSRNREVSNKEAIRRFIDENVTIYVDNSYENEVMALAATIQETGVKMRDSEHCAAAIIAKCDYLLTTDDRFLKYRTDRIKIVTPPQFVEEYEMMKEQMAASENRAVEAN